jgi:Lrp/AsnC family leucine-responsive transcriptional regulator
MLSERLKLDPIDKKIIRLIQSEPTITHTEIAKRVGRSQPTVGLRIKRLENNHILDYQAGVNLKTADFYFSRIKIQTNHPDKIIEIVKKCQLMLTAFRLSGKTNVIIIMVSPKLEFLDDVVNKYFRENEDVLNISMDIITEVINDVVLPVNFNNKRCECCLKEKCTEHLKSKELIK